MSDRFDLVVVGGGIVGLASARAIHRRDPRLSVAVLEKEPAVGLHQTGHNSGVVHSGVYYRPGSRKARLCHDGRAALLDFAAAEGVPSRTVGKLIVAARPAELGVLDELHRRARANEVDGVARLGAAELLGRLPGVAGLGALHVPSAAIIDFGAVARRLAERLAADGVAVLVGRALRTARPTAAGWRLDTGAGEVVAGYVVNCAGLRSDLVARLLGADPPVAIVPFRGDFYRLSDRLRDRIPTLVYPVPDPRLPFLGVHLTPTISGGLLAGPNATLAFAREGYRRGQWDPAEVARQIAFPGTLGLARRYGRFAAGEWFKSWSPAEYLAAIRSVWPSATAGDLGPRTSGVRAQAVRPDGRFEDDFVFVRSDRALHVLNAPSPAATAAFAIAEEVADAAGVGGGAR